MFFVNKWLFRVVYLTDVIVYSVHGSIPVVFSYCCSRLGPHHNVYWSDNCRWIAILTTPVTATDRVPCTVPYSMVAVLPAVVEYLFFLEGGGTVLTCVHLGKKCLDSGSIGPILVDIDRHRSSMCRRTCIVPTE